MPSREETVRDLITDLKRDELYFYNERRCFEFVKANPENTDELIVDEKVSAMNNGVIKSEDIPAFVDHLLSLPVDNALQNDDLDIVVKLAAVKENDPFAFRKLASMYCNFHKPDVYPVQTEIAEELMQAYIQHVFPDAGLPTNILPYLNFKKVCDHFIHEYDFSDFNYYELEKFLWLNARAIREYFMDPNRDQRFSK
jgi:hypothetical protein